MDIIKNEFERRVMPEKKLNKTQILTLTVAGAGLIIVILFVLLLTGNTSKNTGATTKETGATATVSSSSSSTKNYVEGRDYTEKYDNEVLNSDFITKDQLDKALDKIGARDYSTLIGKNMFDDSVVAEFSVYYDKNSNLLEILAERYNKNGNGDPTDTKSLNALYYSLDDYKKVDNDVADKKWNMGDSKFVYSWKNHHKY